MDELVLNGVFVIVAATPDDFQPIETAKGHQFLGKKAAHADLLHSDSGCIDVLAICSEVGSVTDWPTVCAVPLNEPLQEAQSQKLAGISANARSAAR